MRRAKVSIYLDYASPYAYFLAEAIAGFRSRTGAEVAWRPIRLLGLSPFAEGIPYSANRIRYNLADVPRSARFHGVPFRIPSRFPIASDEALRLALVARAEPGFSKLHGALFRAAWAEDRDIAAADVLASCITKAGMDPASLLALARSPETAQQLAAETRAAEEAGVFGVPTAAYAGELFWGVDRLPMLEWAVSESATQ